MMSLLLLVFSFSAVGAICPHEESGLLSWNSADAWSNGQIPQLGDHVVITKNVLLDYQPPEILTLTIQQGAKLVFDPDTNVHLKVHAIYVDGEFHIGSELCPFLGQTRVTFLGNVGEDKVLLVRSGGTLEIHGSQKQSWTRLAKTAYKLQATDGVVVQVQDVPNTSVNRGLVVYQINAVDGSLEDAKLFDMTVSNSNIDNEIANFVSYLNGIPQGRIVGIALRRALATYSRNHNLTSIYNAVDMLAHGNVSPTSLIRQTEIGSAYAILTVKGSPGTSVEVHEHSTGEDHSVTAQSVLNGFYIEVHSFVKKNAECCTSYVSLNVYKDEFYRPTITLLDDVESWNNGDKLVIASTDFDHNQAEEVQILEKPSCKQVRLAAPLEYTHFGEMYKGVDMRAEVGLISRNVKFDSEEAMDSSTYGGHIKILKGFSKVHIEDAEFEGLGQQEVIGSYSLHFHMCGDVDTDEASRPWLRRNSIHHSKSRCVTVHGSHGVIVKDNMCYKTLGHAYFQEDGGELRTVFVGNLGLGTEAGDLIPTDRSCASTFWITNPKTYFRNNAAAGSVCRGIWFTFPDLPIGLSSKNPSMLEREARFTAFYEFDNNVVHSNPTGSGFFVDNILQNDGTATGYNLYTPKKDPVTNNCMDDNQVENCVDEMVYFRRLTGYKNSPQNVWIRGGNIISSQYSISDSFIGVTLLSIDTNVALFLEKSIIIGDSSNVGETEIIQGNEVSIGRSLPFGRSVSRMNLHHVGYEFLKGPAHLSDIYFDDFKNNELYDMGALGFRIDNPAKSSPRSSVIGMLFGFSDPAGGNRVMDVARNASDYQSLDGDDIANFQDLDSSVTDIDDCNDMVTVIKAEPIQLTERCKLRDNWHMAICCDTYAEVKLKRNNMDYDNIVTMSRDDDYQNLVMDSDFENDAPFLVILGGQYSYSIKFKLEVPESFKLMTAGVTNSKYVRVGFCLPPNAKFNLRITHPVALTNINQWTQVNSISALDSDTTGGKYFYDNTTGYFATVLRHSDNFTSDEKRESPNGKDIELVVTILEGDRTVVDCIAQAHTQLGPLKPNQSTKRIVYSELLRLLRRIERRGKREVTTLPKYSSILAADLTEPPPSLGAGIAYRPTLPRK